MQGKQERLLERANLLSQECEQLQSKIVELDDEEHRLREENMALQRRNEVAERTIAKLKVENALVA